MRLSCVYLEIRSPAVVMPSLIFLESDFVADGVIFSLTFGMLGDFLDIPHNARELVTFVENLLRPICGISTSDTAESVEMESCRT